MKKIFIIVMILASCFLTACDGDIPEYIDVGEVSDKTEITASTRTEDLSFGITEDKLKFRGMYDFNNDSNSEEIILEIVNFGQGNECLNIQVGDYKRVVSTFDGSIAKVYGCDIDLNDGVKDLAIITVEYSGDPMIRILKFDSSLTPYNFAIENENPNGKKFASEHSIGYVTYFYFNVNNDDSITIKEQTDSYGMWSVNKSYRINSNGMFQEIFSDTYKVISDYIKDGIDFAEDVSKEEKEMWKKGYIMAHKTHTWEGFTISEGEYFKVLYDNCKNMIFIEKENGESGWISISDEHFADRYEINRYFFGLAG